MKRYKAASGLRAGAWILLAALAGMPVAARAQSVGQPVAVNPAPKVKKTLGTFSGQILSVDADSIRVRGAGSYEVRTFGYTPRVKNKIVRGLAKGRYAKGAAVKIKYVPGSEVASRIRR